MVNFLRNNGIVFDYQPTVMFVCLDEAKTRAVCDITIYTNYCTVIIEIDEFQHKRYSDYISCDMKRMIDVRAAILASGNDLPLLWIRYNPDCYCKDDQLIDTSQDERQAQLLILINQVQQGGIIFEGFGMIYMYYDCSNGRPIILDHADYHPDIAKTFIQSIQ